MSNRIPVTSLFLTMTGKNRPDIVGIGRPQPYRYDYEEKLDALFAKQPPPP